MTNDFIRGLLDEMEKIAKTRAMKEIAAGRLSPQSVERLRSSMRGEREIRRIGSGTEHAVDLVLHPKHGVVVRKIPLALNSSREEVARALSSARQHKKLWQEISRTPGSDEHFTKLLGSKGPARYHEYVPQDKSLLNTRLRPGASGVIERVRKTFPGLYDVQPSDIPHRSNIISGKVIDLSPYISFGGPRGKESAADKALLKMRGKTPDPRSVYGRGAEILSKRVFLGERKGVKK